MGISNILIRGLTRLCYPRRMAISMVWAGGLAVAMLVVLRTTEDINLVVVVEDTARAGFEQIIDAEL